MRWVFSLLLVVLLAAPVAAQQYDIVFDADETIYIPTDWASTFSILANGTATIKFFGQGADSTAAFAVSGADSLYYLRDDHPRLLTFGRHYMLKATVDIITATEVIVTCH